jgi:hypothetical protein
VLLQAGDRSEANVGDEIGRDLDPDLALLGGARFDLRWVGGAGRKRTQPTPLSRVPFRLYKTTGRSGSPMALATPNSVSRSAATVRMTRPLRVGVVIAIFAGVIWPRFTALSARLPFRTETPLTMNVSEGMPEEPQRL